VGYSLCCHGVILACGVCFVKEYRRRAGFFWARRDFTAVLLLGLGVMVAYIFGYGSLVHPRDWVARESVGEPHYGLLSEHQRHFCVGIDNMSPLYDRKHYRFAGERARCIVGACGISLAAGAEVNGLAIAVDDKLFRRICAREKSYNLSGDLREYFSVSLPAPLFSFYPKEANWELYQLGLRTNNIFLPEHYLQYCQEGFAHWGGEEDFLRLSKMPDYPLKDLQFYREPGAI
jgi:hypothetical protein